MSVLLIHTYILTLNLCETFIGLDLFEMTTKVIVVGVMKMGNIVPGVGIEPIFLAFRASVLTLHHISLMSPLYPRPPVYAAQRPVQITTLAPLELEVS